MDRTVRLIIVITCVLCRWVDRPGRSKRMLITGVCLHITGAVLEFILINNWANIVARFLSGKSIT